MKKNNFYYLLLIAPMFGFGQNNPPVANDDTFTVIEDDPQANFNLIANDTDDDGDTLAILSIDEVYSNGCLATVSINQDGLSVDVTLIPDGFGMGRIKYTISDGELTDTAFANFYVNAVDDPPRLNPDNRFADIIVNQTSADSTALVDGLNGFIDIDNDDFDISLSFEDLSQQISENYTSLDEEDVSWLGDGQFIVTLVAATKYAANVLITASNDLSFTHTIKLIVDNAPEANNDTFTIESDSPLTSINVISNDTDNDNSDAIILTSVTTTGTGLVAINADNESVDYTPATGFVGTEVINYTVSQSNLFRSSIGTLTVTVTNALTAPTNDYSNIVTIYPNPTRSILTIDSDKEYDIEVYDMAGNKMMALTGNNINIEHLSTATYIVKATDKSNNEELSYKVLKN